jgi:glycosyltransferase involved in cell wall biosynthesis
MVPSTDPIVHAAEPEPPRTRVMFVLGSLAGGGAERVVAHLMKHINRDEFEPRVGLLWRHGRYLSEFAERDLVVPDLMHGRIPYYDQPPWWHLLPLLALVPLQQREVFRLFHPDIVVTVTKSMNLAARASLAMVGGRPIAWIVREGNNTSAMIDSESRGPLERTLQNTLVRACYRRADRVIAISNGVGASLVNRFKIDPARIRTIFNAVDLAQVRKRAAESIALPLNRPFIVAAGRLVHQKGFDLLIRAYAERIAHRGVALVILGEGPERTRLEQLARDATVGDDVHLPGFVDNPWAYFARASMFVCSSRWEGFGNVIVEAMASGAPVVATDCDFGPREIVQHEKTGLLVPVESVDRLGAAMASLLDDPSLASRLGTAGRRRALDFDVEQMTRAYETIFRELKPRSNPRS